MSASASATALITGASSGIGAAFAHRLAAQGYNLVLVARREGLLRKLADEVRQKSNVDARVFSADLSDPAQIRQVERLIAGIADLDILINDAGFGVPGKFSEIEAERNVAMIQVHVVATVQLCRAALPGMIARGRGSIINVSSVAAFMPTPGNTIYSATKACVNVFSEALQNELKGTGVKVQALCPGLTHTEFHDHPGYEIYKTKIPEFFWTSADDVVTESLEALKKERVICIPGFKNRLAVAAARSRIGALVIKRLAAWVHQAK